MLAYKQTKGNYVMNNIEITIDSIKKGYTQINDEYQCLHCGAVYMQHLVYPNNDVLELAEYAMQRHISEVHGGALKPLLEMEKQDSGISDIQQQFLKLMSSGVSDKEIAERLNISASAVRNHRFKLREKKKQAKILIAVMDLIEDKKQIPTTYKSLKDSDERFQISDKDRQDVFENFVDESGYITVLPRKEKKKIILFQEMAKEFALNRNYSEQEVNELIKQKFADFVTVRRYLVEYGMLGRTNDGTAYWTL